STLSISQDAIRDFLRKVNVEFPQYVRDHELELRVKEIVKHWGDEQALRPYVITALILTITAYAHVSDLETRVLITLFTTLIIAMDDPVVFNGLIPGDFHRKMCTGVIQQEHGMLGELTKVLQSMWDHYPSFSANTVYASALRFVNASVMENEWRGEVYTLEARPFLEYKRSMTATTEAYACFIWPRAQFPDYRVYVRAIPDILSFYKEELAGEEDNYIHERALATGSSASDALQGVIDDTITAVKRVRSVLGNGEARAAWENFAAGYISVHTHNPRYRLKDILAHAQLWTRPSSLATSNSRPWTREQYGPELAQARFPYKSEGRGVLPMDVLLTEQADTVVSTFIASSQLAGLIYVSTRGYDKYIVPLQTVHCANLSRNIATKQASEPTAQQRPRHVSMTCTRICRPRETATVGWCCIASLISLGLTNSIQSSALLLAQQAVRSFLDNVDVDLPKYTRDLELERRVNEIVSQLGDERTMRPYVVPATILTITAYAHITDMETKVHVTVFTTFIAIMDDPAFFDGLTPADFHRNMCSGVVQRDPGLLGEFTKVLGRMWDHYPGFTANTIYASALRFINASVMENEWQGETFCREARPFVEYKRSMTATTEAYACFIWPIAQFPDYRAYVQAIPDTMLYVSHVNDILSFYKEELAGEKDNYIHERALATGRPTAQVLQELTGETIAAVKRVRYVLRDTDARAAWENFAAGYIRVHTDSSRYRLKDILGGEYLLDISSD
ncbi:Trichodiene synthase-domain-containing protein, partial [Fomitopsis serialis]|uniref:Trichodiene synthase-domain-containing protein n=1 Tax=Fomitopsis serialis TaxID=139415 RepID=UPI002008DBDF